MGSGGIGRVTIYDIYNPALYHSFRPSSQFPQVLLPILASDFRTKISKERNEENETFDSIDRAFWHTRTRR